MNPRKKIFIICSVVFFALLIYASFDIGSRTTFPGSKPQLKERIRDQYISTDSATDGWQKADSI